MWRQLANIGLRQLSSLCPQYGHNRCPSFGSSPDMFFLSAPKSTKWRWVIHPQPLFFMPWHNLTIHPLSLHRGKTTYSSSPCFTITTHPSSAGCRKTPPSVQHTPLTRSADRLQICLDTHLTHWFPLEMWTLIIKLSYITNSQKQAYEVSNIIYEAKRKS